MAASSQPTKRSSLERLLREGSSNDGESAEKQSLQRKRFRGPRDVTTVVPLQELIGQLVMILKNMLADDKFQIAGLNTSRSKQQITDIVSRLENLKENLNEEIPIPKRVDENNWESLADASKNEEQLGELQNTTQFFIENEPTKPSSSNGQPDDEQSYPPVEERSEQPISNFTSLLDDANPIEIFPNINSNTTSLKENNNKLFRKITTEMTEILNQITKAKTDNPDIKPYQIPYISFSKIQQTIQSRPFVRQIIGDKYDQMLAILRSLKLLQSSAAISFILNISSEKIYNIILIILGPKVASAGDIENEINNFNRLGAASQKTHPLYLSKFNGLLNVLTNLKKKDSEINFMIAFLDDFVKEKLVQKYSEIFWFENFLNAFSDNPYKSIDNSPVFNPPDTIRETIYRYSLLKYQISEIISVYTGDYSIFQNLQKIGNGYMRPSIDKITEMLHNIQTLVEEKKVDVDLNKLKDDVKECAENNAKLEERLQQNERELQILKVRDKTLDAESSLFQEREKTIATLGTVIHELTQTTASYISSSKSKQSLEYIDLDQDINKQIIRYNNPAELLVLKNELEKKLGEIRNKRSEFVKAFGFISQPFIFITTLNKQLSNSHLTNLNESSLEDSLKLLLSTNPGDKLIVLLNLYFEEFNNPDAFKNNEQYWYDQLLQASFSSKAQDDQGIPVSSSSSSKTEDDEDIPVSSPPGVLSINRKTIDEFVRAKQKAIKKIKAYKESLVDAQIANISELKDQLAVIQKTSADFAPLLGRMERLKEEDERISGKKLESLSAKIILAQSNLIQLRTREEEAKNATEEYTQVYRRDVAAYLDAKITTTGDPDLVVLRNNLANYNIKTILTKLAELKQKEDERGAYVQIASETIERINRARKKVQENAYVAGINSIKGTFEELSKKLSNDIENAQTEVNQLLQKVTTDIKEQSTALEGLNISRYTTELQKLLTGVGVIVSELKLSPNSTLLVTLNDIQAILKNLSSSNLTETQLTNIITRTYDSKIRPSVSAFEQFMNDFNSRGYSTREDIQRMLNTYLSNQKNEIENIVQLMIKNDPEIQNIFKSGTQSMDTYMLELRNKLHKELSELITKADSSILTPERVKGVLSNSIIEALQTNPNMVKMVEMAKQSRQPITQSQLKSIIDSQKQEMQTYYKPLFDAMQAKFLGISKTTLTQDQAFTFFYDSFNSFLRTDPRIKLLLDTLSTGTSNGITEEKFKELIKNVLQEETGSRNKAYEDIKTDLIEALEFQLSQFQPPTLSSETVKKVLGDEIAGVINQVQLSNKTNYNAIVEAIRQIPSPTLDTSKVSTAVSSQISKLVTQIETSNMEKYNKILSTISSPTIDVTAINRGVSAKVSNLINEIKTSNEQTNAAILAAISRPTLSTDEVSNAVYSKINELINQVEASNRQNNTAILEAIQKITPPAITSDMIKEASETAIKNAMSEIVRSIEQLKTSEQVDRQNIISTFEQLQERGYAELQSRIERLLVSNDSILRELVGNTNAMLAQSKNAEQRTVDDIHGIRESINRLEKYYKSMMKINAHPEQNKRLKDISEKAHKVFGEVDPKVRHPHLKDIVDISKQYRDTSERHKENLRLYMHRRMQKKTPVLEDTTAESSFRSKSRRTMSARTDDSSSFDPSYEEERSIEESDFLDDDIPVMGKTVQRTQTRLPQPPPQSEPQEHAVVPITLWKRSLSQLVDILDGGDPFSVYDDVMRHIAADDADMKEIMELFKRFTQDVEGLVGKPRGAFCDPNLNFVEKYAREVLKIAAQLLPSLELRDLLNPKKKEELVAHARPIVEIAVKRRSTTTLSQMINSDVSPALMHTVGKYIFELPYQTSYSFIDSSSHENIVESISRGVVENMVVGHTSGEHMKLPTPTSVRKYLDQQLESRDVSRDVMDIFRPLVDQPFFSAFLTSLQHIDYDARRDASMALLKSRLESTIFKQLVGACYNFNSTVSNRFSSAIVQRQAGDRLGVFIDIARKHFIDSYAESKPILQTTVSPFQLSRRGQRR